MSTPIWATYNMVIILDHQPCLYVALSKHHDRKGLLGRTFGRLEGRCRLTSFCRPTHCRCSAVRSATPDLVLKFAMMMLNLQVRPASLTIKNARHTRRRG